MGRSFIIGSFIIMEMAQNSMNDLRIVSETDTIRK